LLSALAKPATVAVSASFPIEALGDDRFYRHSLLHPLLDELATISRAYLVTGLSTLQARAIAEQVERVSNQRASTASESTF
jgi:hypothetical protein